MARLATRVRLLRQAQKRAGLSEMCIGHSNCELTFEGCQGQVLTSLAVVGAWPASASHLRWVLPPLGRAGLWPAFELWRSGGHELESAPDLCKCASCFFACVPCCAMLACTCTASCMGPPRGTSVELSVES